LGSGFSLNKKFKIEDLWNSVWLYKIDGAMRLHKFSIFNLQSSILKVFSTGNLESRPGGKPINPGRNNTGETKWWKQLHPIMWS
jgi:hypothetical protein